MELECYSRQAVESIKSLFFRRNETSELCFRDKESDGILGKGWIARREVGGKKMI